MSWRDFRRSVTQNRAVIVPIGSLEQHGPHLPLGTDTIIVTAIAERVAERTGSVVAPSIAYGFKPQPGCSGGNEFPGTCSLDGQTLTLLVKDVIRELARHKVHGILVLDGHYENSFFLNEGTDLALRDIPKANRVKVVIARWFDLIPNNAFVKLFGKSFQGMALEHASKVETSMVMALNPKIVQRNKMKNDAPRRREEYTVLPEDRDFTPRSGVLSTVFPSSGAIGKQLLDYAIREIALIVKKEFAE
jgi:creatinine amidohydrolase